MKRELEFRAYLKKHKPRSENDYVCYCKRIESAFGKEIDELIVNVQSISRIKEVLHTNGASAKHITSCISGFNAYLEFAFHATAPSAGGIILPSASRYHVARANGVPLTEDVAFVAQTLEQEYASIVQFAKDVLFPSGVCHIPFDYIPVIISDETPFQDSPDGKEKVLGTFFPSEKPYIEIYYRNGNARNPAQFRKCLAHEYLHYLHYAYAGAEFYNAKKELKEALADFFGVLYSVYRHGKDDLAIAKSRYALWEKNFGTYWPYAYALHFCRVGGKTMEYASDYSQYVRQRSVGKFVQIFCSTPHPDDAFDDLIK